MKKSPLIERHLAIKDLPSINLRTLRRELYLGKLTESNFTCVSAPIPPKFETHFMVVRNNKEIVVCAWLPTKSHARGELAASYRGSVEVAFDFHNDGYGFSKIVFQEGKDLRHVDFSPYPETKTTKGRPLKVKRWGFDSQPLTNRSMFVCTDTIFYAVFDEDELFFHSKVIGFNFVRGDEGDDTLSAWSFLAGNGVPDATSLGKLHQSAATLGKKRTAPIFGPSKKFRISVTNDTPMMIIDRAYTPASLDAEMEGLKKWGVNRVEWIDYSNNPGFWMHQRWNKHYQKTIQACGELLPTACKAAKKHGIELVPVFKPFDLVFHHAMSKKTQYDLPVLGDLPFRITPDMLGNDDAYMQTNPAWRKGPSFPIRTLRFFSIHAISGLDLKRIRLFQSADNITYKSVKVSTSKIVVKKVRRPARQWSPAGITNLSDTENVWMIEINGLSITEPFVQIDVVESDITLTNRQFALIEAIGKDGSETAFICSNTRADGNVQVSNSHPYRFVFSGAWPGWNNYNDELVDWKTVSLKSLGISFAEKSTLYGMLEPTHSTAQTIWLDRVDAYLDEDIAGLNIRTLCHHRSCSSWLQYAFGPSVIAAFKERYRRTPQPVEADYERVRRLRGEAMGDFLAVSSAKARNKNKKFIFQVETGGELPANRDSRMAMFYDYKRWISAGLFDELHVRAITGHSPWLRQVILPLAKQYGVEVHLMTRNNAKGYGHRDYLEIQRIVTDAKALGYDGLNFYESANLYRLTEEGTFVSSAMGDFCTKEAVRLAK